VSALWAAWQRFFFTPRPTTTAGVVRIALGLVLLMEAYSWWPDVTTWFAADGLSPGATGSESAILGAYAVFVVAGLAVTVGAFTRPATVVAYLLLLAFQHRMPYVFNSGDLLLRLLVGLLCFAPAGAALSVDRWRRDRAAFWTAPVRPVWALRLMQVQVALMYASTVWQKLRSVTWNNGLAMYYGLAQPDLSRVPVPDALLHRSLLMNVVTWGMLAFEIAFVVFVWNRRARPYVLAAGVVVHVLGHVFLVLGLFTYVVLAGYAAFVDWDRLRASGPR
jgi:hypothetical protein